MLIWYTFRHIVANCNKSKKKLFLLSHGRSQQFKSAIAQMGGKYSVNPSVWTIIPFLNELKKNKLFLKTRGHDFKNMI